MNKPFNPWKNDKLALANSYERPYVLVREMLREPDDRNRLALFLAHWPMCDAPWAYRSWIAEVVRAALNWVDLADVLGSDESEWFGSLPDLIPIYRGCERGRERGLSWTTDINVALEFAQGRRCTNQHPTLMTAIIPKLHVFGVFLDRKESEIAVDPRRLRRLRPVESYVAPLVRAA
jgi:hypothetical protein